ncbi:Tim44 domain-containing protein [Pseudomonas cichorii]|nr:Tim44 domain-containing protein [Pseudomonas cichorii]MBX8539466.1 Tim44 domain-containing protein [Pseudomonas cichorii]MBX8554137.1 Tim44 domain-containing protein [Pseudomonas cichorii]MBX8562254.1 Tim44 domain-containing protein [Pseudomonas cichorii]MBX8579394.1 Tim44 domain-containing protein [Pseudomonas cichorii]MBX8596716.1 Tim44 domain-containing protein [Pseudomonas cichorii]
MQRFLSMALALCIGLTMSLDVNAARFGGGKSMGSAPSHQARQAAPATPAAAPNAAGRPAAAASGASRWLGPLAGIAAGGLLAAMFMGDGFNGLQIFDILIMGLIAFLIFRFIARRRQQQQPKMAGAGAPYQRETSQPAQNSIFGGASSAPAAPVINAPAWFNEERFLEAARSHFQSLQQHWDANEMDKIAEFVTPQMLQFLKKERAGLGDGFQSTYIDNLNVQLEGVDDRADKTIATLTFSGVSKTSRFDQGEVFSESWNMERAQGDNQPWLVAGIRQNG